LTTSALTGSSTQWLQNRASWRHLQGEDTPCIQHHEPVTMPAPQHAGIVSKRCNGMLDDFVITDGVRFVVRDVQVVAAREPDPKHNGCHARSLGVLLIGRHLTSERRQEQTWCYEVCGTASAYRQRR
jgi:hypothetical protein